MTQSPVVISLPQTRDAPAIARAFVAEHLGRLAPSLVADAELLVSELVTNALLHGRPTITLQIRLSTSGMTLAVSDEGDPIPASRVKSHSSVPNGRGLLIVDAVAADWGVIPADPPPGKTVWFELRSA
ncbi:anti-sigma regulatory factor (Ser/Thr protein kinase) [Jatrophihabitans sp. GAS493]|uniref:ATP-binding protein n=1 Tax=Jatrophihabitans sp. GAS493 TaxID=1907575 RepID=UPI000BB9BC21|nr:ATP-binding protein [Jatrophihabitans sp. GAS493]SOD73273.1 anti-sigma regulatory factor (Ser/Thr protein kinase) [Jatrophihabitans sp. GAS493]